ncbi:putative late blight resistance protein homolog R1B-17 isoform X2 [Olea europaea var. sylvestris]|uniref:putative late blight resistance protein homolog R1B-17 isoform X2 n=1 Tax=Olea europaea var. sylvestris TaxID=158386 RepID=UPI000C1D1583|nr:putative late blight resistance protein homolog R1B-17 isoform X2 [Olea europaea var. sylvestris]
MLPRCVDFSFLCLTNFFLRSEMAYAAVLSLNETLHQIFFGDTFCTLYDSRKRNTLIQKVNEIKNLLIKLSQNSSEEVKLLEIKIRDMAYHAEDVIEVLQIGLQKRSDSRMQEDLITEMDTTIKDLHEVITEMETIMEEMEKIKGGSGEQNLPVNWNYFSSRSAPGGRTNMVGFGEDLMQIKDRLCNVQKSTRQTIPIVGMGGIGKTTLAMNVYNDPVIADHFYLCAWVTISLQYHITEILLGILDDIGVLTNKIRKESDEQLKERVYKSLKGRRYLIVMDDVWSTNAWNDIQMLFPDDNNGSRILLTTRLTHVADYASSTNPPHLMHFLTEEESWNLLCQNVFREANCPLELVDVGSNIAKNCQGLPLLIVVVAGLLAKKNKSLDYWKYLAVNLSSIIIEKKDHCSEILTLSYNNLPPLLKPCFLYMGIFPENYEIPVSRLIKLWVAEGFANHPFEAERYLMDLIGRNLILVGQKGSIDGKIKTCRMHDLLKVLCVRIAHEENFLYVKSRHLRFLPQEISFKRRLSIHDDASYSGSEEDVTMQSMDLVRSFIYNGWDETQLHSYYYFGCRLLRVLDMVGVELSGFPEEILLLVNLRYVAIACHAVIPASITVLWNLITLIVEDSTGIASILPIEIWNMPRLRHLKFSRVFLPAPLHASPFLRLNSLSVLDSLDYDIGQITPLLKKLGIHYNSQSSHSLNHLAYFLNLETLKILFDSPANSTFINTALPSCLKKITLERGRIDWEYMRIFGSLPNLEVLKLREYAFQGREWIPNEGEFLQLKFLLIWETDLEHWRAKDTHFPRLEHLILRNCSNLVEVPSDIGEIPTLETIEIDYSSPSAVDSAKKILEDQLYQGNDGLKVFVHPTKTQVYPLKFGIQQDESGRFYRRKTKLDEFKIQQDESGRSDGRKTKLDEFKTEEKSGSSSDA